MPWARYQAEIFRGTSTVPIIETARITTGVAQPSLMVGRPRTDLAASASLITPPQASATSLEVRWNRVAGAPRIESAYAYTTAPSYVANPSVSVLDAFQLSPTSTSAVVPGSFPAMPPAFREVGISGYQDRTVFIHSLRWSY